MEGWLEGNLMLAERARRMLTRKLEFPMLGIGGWNIEGEGWVVKARLAEAFIQLEHGPWVGRQIDRSGTGRRQVGDRSTPTGWRCQFESAENISFDSPPALQNMAKRASGP